MMLMSRAKGISAFGKGRMWQDEGTCLVVKGAALLAEPILDAMQQRLHARSVLLL
jgi:hypothetical protein